MQFKSYLYPNVKISIMKGNSNNARSYCNETKTCNYKLESSQKLQKAVIQTVSFEWQVIG